MQTKKGSMFEVCCNVGSGIISAVIAWKTIVIPWSEYWSWDMNNLILAQIMAINITCTIISVVRGYGWRRLFNWLEAQGIVK